MEIKDNQTKIKLADQQGEAYLKAVEYLKKITSGNEEKRQDDYIVTVCAEEAEGMYHLEDGELDWQNPLEGQNAHLEVIVQDIDDKRFIPGLKVHAAILTEDQELIEEKELPFLWHPYVFHYGASWKLPKEGKYFVDVKIKAPDFPRHDIVKGKKYSKNVQLLFGPIHMETDRKLNAPE